MSATLSMAHRLGLEEVAEGIEAVDQSQMLGSLGCPLGRGYLYSTPIDAETLAASAKPLEESVAEKGNGSSVGVGAASEQDAPAREPETVLQ